MSDVSLGEERRDCNMPSGSKLSDPAVQVQNACKAYQKGVPILNNFSMTVERGTIYGLLGASGCGKTTMLSCLVGLKSVDSGEIKVLGARPGTKGSGIPGKTIGYMPQEIALYSQFSIKEILEYFGRLYEMSQDEVASRMEFLIKFLHLPDCAQLISSLSGGQQRRTSLAVAMIHEPQLLILDEPTVGVDPLIRENIWKYLCEIVKSRETTVIITTHYIEEARQSNMIGLMRNGRLLVEDSPQKLLEAHNTVLLEDIVLKLCQKDNNDIHSAFNLADEDVFSESIFDSNPNSQRDMTDSVIALKYKSRSPDFNTLIYQSKTLTNDRKRQSVGQTLNDNVSSHYNKTMAILIRNYLRLFRFPLYLLLILLIPTMQIILLNLLLGKEPSEIHMGIVNKEFLSGSLESCTMSETGCLAANMSCRFVEEFYSELKWKDFGSEVEALENVNLGNAWGYISIPKNFTEQMKNRYLWKNFISNETIDGSTITVRLDMTNNLLNSFMISTFLKKYRSFVQNLVSDCKDDPRAIDIPLNFNSMYGSIDGGYLDFLQPALILLIMILLPMANSVGYVLDKKSGTFERTMVAGGNIYHMFISMIISETTLIVLEILVCFGVAVLLFGMTNQGSWFWIFILSLLTGITGLSLGFLVGTVCSHEVDLVIMCLAIYTTTMSYSGAFWPIPAVKPWFMKVICYLSPTALPIESFRSIVTRGWGVTHPNVWPGFASLTIWILSLCLFALFLNRRNYSLS